jgi:ferric-dicitrate binding protein FerR (iron transport regulator)
MSLSDFERDLLLRFSEQALSSEEERQLAVLLAENAAAREFLHDLAELAIVVADGRRLATAVANPLSTPRSPSRATDDTVPPARRWWLGGLATAALCALVGGGLWGAERLWSFRPNTASALEPRAQVGQSGGLVQLFDGRGLFISPVPPGQPLRAGDLLRTHSSDAWVELRLLPVGSSPAQGLPASGSLIVSGHSGLKFLDAPQHAQSFVLERGSLWIDSLAAPHPDVAITTMVAEIRASRAVFSLQSSADESIVRVEAGQAGVLERLTSRRLTVSAGEEVAISLLQPGEARVVRQPAPVSHWQLRLPEGRVASFGTILSNAPGDLRIRAAPLLWPLPDREPVLLHVVAIAAWQCSQAPVVVTPGSRLRYRGRLQRPQMVRFGFSTARVRGVFAGKFEIDIPAGRLDAAEDGWEIEIPLADFHPLAEQSVNLPLGMELTDVYALTITSDAGLELHDIELIPAKPSLEETP